MSTRKTITFILNPISGTVKKAGIPDLISSTLDASRFEHRIVWTEYAGHASVIAHEERELGTDVVVAVGGDGTVNEVGRSLVDSPTAMAARFTAWTMESSTTIRFSVPAAWDSMPLSARNLLKPVSEER